MISNLANETKHHRTEISQLAQVFLKLLDTYGSDDFTITAASNASTASDSSLPPFSALDNPSPDPTFRLSAIFLRAINSEAHPCMCENCMPEFAKTLADRAEKDAALIYQRELKAEVKEGMRREFVKTLTAEAESDAKKSVRDKIRKRCQEEVLQETKAQLTQKLRAE